MTNKRRAVITGITGQDGYYLARHLLMSKGYEVVGIARRTSLPSDTRLRSLRASPCLHIVDGDVTDMASIMDTVKAFKPDHFYHLAAQSHVGRSWLSPVATSEITGMGTLNCLEAIRKVSPSTRFYFAGSSEMFGNSSDGTSPLNEESPMLPESPYATAKLFGYHMTRTYRRSYGMHASCGILFNHESPLRGEEFVTRKITLGLARIKHGLQEKIKLGNLQAKRDWGHARDYVRAMVMMLERDCPDDFVIATGQTYSVQQFLELACKYFRLNPDEVVEIDQAFVRPKDVNVLLGSPHKAHKLLRWEPQISLEKLVEDMCSYDFLFTHPDPAKQALADSMLMNVGP